MNINSIQGAGAYTASTPLEETTRVQNQNRNTAEADQNRENTRANQEAFQVTITQEARAQQTANLETYTQPLQTQSPEPPQLSEPPTSPEPYQTSTRQQETPVVDIVA